MDNNHSMFDEFGDRDLCDENQEIENFKKSFEIPLQRKFNFKFKEQPIFSSNQSTNAKQQSKIMIHSVLTKRNPNINECDNFSHINKANNLNSFEPSLPNHGSSKNEFMNENNENLHESPSFKIPVDKLESRSNRMFDNSDDSINETNYFKIKPGDGLPSVTSYKVKPINSSPTPIVSESQIKPMETQKANDKQFVSSYFSDKANKKPTRSLNQKGTYLNGLLDTLD